MNGIPFVFFYKWNKVSTKSVYFGTKLLPRIDWHKEGILVFVQRLKTEFRLESLTFRRCWCGCWTLSRFNTCAIYLRYQGNTELICSRINLTIHIYYYLDFWVALGTTSNTENQNTIQPSRMEQTNCCIGYLELHLHWWFSPLFNGLCMGFVKWRFTADIFCMAYSIPRTSAFIC